MMTAGVTGCPAGAGGAAGKPYKGGGDCFTLVQLLKRK